MLDTNFNAKLGDFGLAQLVEHDIEASAHTTLVAGTLGYLAPECVMTGKTSLESDVFSFGVGKVLDAAAESLRGDFNADEMERLMILGLWCAHPDPNSKPSMREVIKVLKLEAPLPHIPLTMHIVVFLSTADPFQHIDVLNSMANLYGTSSASSSGMASFSPCQPLEVAAFSSGKTGYNYNTSVNNKLVNMYMKCGSVKNGHKMCDKMPQRALIACNSTIARCVHHGEADEALNLFAQMYR
ncbi:hypothetical protein KI387_001391 [Taxus chinensis]|uniref:Protein kinase domain-containing protein n=1 Tax=Taxus chinensis TaxID=29808 RepID=A0AA38LLH5_TAXCH|nr:hypothetical protein KI387_001391 [Taxus chinensis]